MFTYSKLTQATFSGVVVLYSPDCLQVSFI